MKTIALIIPYFGELPNYFDYWFESAKKNDTIDFLIFTDNIIESSSKNIKIYNMSFDNLKEMIQSKFDFKIFLENPARDICLFKPAYGLVFSEYIKNYDFWGFCDVDLIFGDIRSFITDEILSTHDKILSHGHFTLLRNNEEMNSLFMKKRKDCIYYKDAFSSCVKWNNYDEYPYGFSRLARVENKKIYEKGIFADVDTFSFTFRKLYSYLPEVDDNQNVVQYFEWSEGKLFDVIYNSDNNTWNKTPLMYAHFQKRHFEIEEYHGSDHFYILPNYFSTKLISEEELLKSIDVSKNQEYCVRKTSALSNRAKIPFIKKMFSIQTWKRKLFLLKMKMIYKVDTYKFSRGGF